MRGITDSILDLAEASCSAALASVPTRRLVGQALLDWVGCAIAGVDLRSSRIAVRYIQEEYAAGCASVLGQRQRVGVAGAAFANGVLSHALDFDDANLLMPGHPGVVLFPPLLALAEAQGRSGAALIEAYLFGIELACRIGQWLAPSHYARGFHATGTVGTLGAAAACARMLDSPSGVVRQAIGLACAQASGLVGLFGTDAKHLHVGNAALHGYLAASLARQGFTAPDDALERPQGFADTHDGARDRAAALAPFAGGHAMHQTLFKYHAACYGTHAALECASRVRAEGEVEIRRIRAIDIDVGEECVRTCDIVDPRTQEQAKFSLRFNAAVGLLGLPTGDLATYAAEVCARKDVIDLRDRVRVHFIPGRPLTQATMRVMDDRGVVREASADTSQPMLDLDEQQARLRTKFEALVAHRLTVAERARLAELCLNLAELDSMEPLTDLLRRVRLSPSDDPHFGELT